MSNKTKMLYNVDEKLHGKTLVLQGIQWALFMVYGVVLAYSLLGIGADMSKDEIIIFITNVIFVMGISTLVQASVGHRMGAMSAPNVVTLLAVLSIVNSLGKEQGFQAYNAFMIAGIIVAILGYMGVIGKIHRVWSPLVAGTMIMTIGLSVMSLGVSSLAKYGFGFPFAAGLCLAALCGVLSIKGRGILATLPALIVLSAGYIIFIAIGKFDWSLMRDMPVFTHPTPFPYGWSLPSLDLLMAMLVIALFDALVCYGNLAGLSAVVGKDLTEKQTRKSFMIKGLVETSFAGLFGVPGTVMYAENIGYILLTRVASRYPLYIAGFIFIILSFAGKVIGFLSAIPEPLAGAILLGFASPLIGTGAGLWRNVEEFSTREMFICGFSIFVAMGLSTLPATVWANTTDLIAVLFTTPSLVSAIMVIIFEQIIFRRPCKDQKRIMDNTA